LHARLQHAPGEQARHDEAPQQGSPSPSRWTLQGIGGTFDWLNNYTVSGVWRVLQRCTLRLRSTRLRRYRLDPDDDTKVAHLERCLQDAALHPDDLVLVFLDEMGYSTGLPRPVCGPQLHPLRCPRPSRQVRRRSRGGSSARSTR